MNSIYLDNINIPSIWTRFISDSKIEHLVRLSAFGRIFFVVVVVIVIFPSRWKILKHYRTEGEKKNVKPKLKMDIAWFRNPSKAYLKFEISNEKKPSRRKDKKRMRRKAQNKRNNNSIQGEKGRERESIDGEWLKHSFHKRRLHSDWNLNRWLIDYLRQSSGQTIYAFSFDLTNVVGVFFFLLSFKTWHFFFFLIKYSEINMNIREPECFHLPNVIV